MTLIHSPMYISVQLSRLCFPYVQLKWAYEVIRVCFCPYETRNNSFFTDFLGKTFILQFSMPKQWENSFFLRFSLGIKYILWFSMPKTHVSVLIIAFPHGTDVLSALSELRIILSAVNSNGEFL